MYPRLLLRLVGQEARFLHLILLADIQDVSDLYPSYQLSYISNFTEIYPEILRYFSLFQYNILGIEVFASLDQFISNQGSHCFSCSLV